MGLHLSVTVVGWTHCQMAVPSIREAGCAGLGAARQTVAEPSGEHRRETNTAAGTLADRRRPVPVVSPVDPLRGREEVANLVQLDAPMAAPTC